jgi:hypothetical protein
MPVPLMPVPLMPVPLMPVPSCLCPSCLCPSCLCPPHQGEEHHAKYAQQANVTLITVVVRNFRIPVLITVADIAEGGRPAGPGCALRVGQAVH